MEYSLEGCEFCSIYWWLEILSKTLAEPLLHEELWDLCSEFGYEIDLWSWVNNTQFLYSRIFLIWEVGGWLAAESVHIKNSWCVTLSWNVFSWEDAWGGTYLVELVLHPSSPHHLWSLITLWPTARSKKGKPLDAIIVKVPLRLSPKQ